MVLKATDSPCRDVILKALTRLNEKSTLRAAADELAIIVRALDTESLSALVQSICSTAGWEPKPVAKKECVRTLALLPLPSCPVADVALQQHLPKILVYLRKTLQDTDSVVREASGEALAAYALGCTRLYGCPVPGSTAAPVVKVVFDCLAEQKKEAQMGASQALLKMSPSLGPLDKDLVKLILKLLRSPSFLGSAQLLAAIASTDTEMRVPGGLLKHGASAFLPYINHLVGQPAAQRRSSQQEPSGPSSGGGSTASGSTISVSSTPLSASGILGCLSSKDWAVRRAAADAVRAAVLLLGPELEPEGCWGLGDPGSVTGRCLNALEECRFDKVKEAREVAREAAALIHQLHRFVGEEGEDGHWPSWASNNLPYAGWQSSVPASPRSPLPPKSPGGRSFKQLQMSPSFKRAAVDTDVVVDASTRALLLPNSTSAAEDEHEEADAAAAFAGDEEAGNDAAVCEEVAAAEAEVLAPEFSLQQQNSQHDMHAPLAAEHSSSSTSSSVRGSRAVSKQHSQASVGEAAEPPPPGLQPRKLVLNGSAAVRCSVRSSSNINTPRTSSRPSSAPSSNTSRRSSAQDQAAPLAKQSSSSAVAAGGGGPVPSYAAGTKSSAAKGGAAAAGGRCPPVPGSSRRASSTRPQAAAAGGGAWQGPSQLEWQQLQLQLSEQQQLVVHLQEQAASSAAAFVALQERVAALEVQVQHQQLVMQEQRQLIHQQQQQQKMSLSPAGAATTTTSTPPGSLQSSRRSPSRCSSSPSAGLTASAVAAISTSPVGGVLSREVQQQVFAMQLHQQQHQQQLPSPISQGPPSSSSNRLYKSAEWGTPHGSSSGARKALISPIDPLSGVGHRSFNSLLTPTGGGSGLKSCESGMATPGDLESAYADALQRNERGGVHLLRLIQKTGPVWPQLSATTCTGLMEVFIKHVRDGVMLHRVLPWLWRLADDSNAGRPEVPVALRQQLLDALECCPAAEDLQAQEKVCLLLDTLKAVWVVEEQNGA